MDHETAVPSLVPAAANKSEEQINDVAHSVADRVRLYSSSGLLLAKGYVRVVTLAPAAAKEHGGPYAELFSEQVRWDSFHPIPNPCPFHLNKQKKPSRHRYFREFRSNDAENIMLYVQQLRVKYADYIIGRCYIGIADLRTVVQPLKAKAAA
jgi:hypothetical protein